MASHAMTILHIDMDAFYASVEQRDRPECRGKPVIVGGLAGRGVVCAASYEARKFGVHSAMPVANARRLCPEGIFLPVRMSHYAEISQQIRELFFSFTPLVEPLSLDEAFLDVNGCEGLFGSAPEIAQQIKSRIRSELGLIASVGVATNKYLAKLASDHGKPDGFIVIPEERITAFLAPLPVGRIWGVGAKAEKRLHALGIRTIGQLAALPEKILIGHFGQAGRHVWQLAQGQDERRVVPDRDAKSISTETTFSQDIGDRQILRSWLLSLVDQLASRLRHAGLHAGTLEVKIRASDFRTWTRSQALPEATNGTQAIWQFAAALFERSLSQAMLPVRLLGVGASRLVRGGTVQAQLFDTALRERETSLDRTIDAIRGEFGSGAIQRGSLLNPADPE